LRLVVRAVNFGGYAGGAMPHFWATDPASLADGTKSTYGPAIVRELEVYAVGSAIQDVTAPAPPVVVVAGSFGADQEAALPVSGSAEPGSRMAVRIEVGGRTSVPVTTTAGAGGTWAVTLNTTGLPAGPAWVTATATDALGNTSQPGRAASHKTSGAPPIPPRPPVPPTTGTPVPPTTSTPLPPTTGTPGPTSPNPPTVATPTPAHTLLGQNGGQSAPAGAPYAKPLGVRVLDAAQRPVAGRKVVFTGASTGARVGFPGTTASVVTNAQGWAYSPTVRAGAVVGTVHVTASTSTAAPLQLRLTITPSVTAVPRTRLVRAGTVLKAGGPLTVSVWGRGGVPGGAAKAAIEVTTSGSAAGGSVRLSPTGRWAASDVRAPVTKGRLRTTLLMAPIGPDGRIRLRNDSKGAVAVSIELQGWLTSGARMSVPARTVGRLVLDTAAGGGSNGLARNRPVAVPVARKGAARSALVRIVVTSRVRGGHLFAYPHGGRRPSIPVAPVSAGAVSRTALLPVGRDGRIALYSSARPGLQASVRVIALYR
jgi:hypothetical protein